MITNDRHSTPSPRHALRSRANLLGIAVLACLVSAAPSVLPEAAAATPKASGDGYQPPYCTTTALQQYAACLFDVRDNLFTANAICLNVSDPADRRHCYAEAADAQSEDTALCGEQGKARKNLCAVLGEARYDPAFVAANFDGDFGHLSHPNPYRPLGIGNRWSYAGSETIEIEVLDKTKLIAGVPCIVVNDQVQDEGVVVEDTNDWFAQAKNRDVWYCGEESQDFETFEGDQPPEPELVSIDGSFKAGRDHDKAGIVLPGSPRVGMIYRQEFSAGNAEDTATILTTSYSYGTTPKLDRFIPRALAKRFCSARDCIVTAESTPLEPGVVERKYYARGVGEIFSVHLDTGESTQLVDCNFNAKCNGLPMP